MKDTIKFTPRGGEAHFIKCLRDEIPCIFKEALPDTKRTIRGNVLSKILSGDETLFSKSSIALPKHILIENCIISNKLSLVDVKCDFALCVKNSLFLTSPDFSRAQFIQISLEGSTLPGASFVQAVSLSHIWLDDVISTDTIDISYAIIGGQLSANKNTEGKGHFASPGGYSIAAQQTKIAGGVYLNNAVFDSCVAFQNAEVGGEFEAENINLKGSNEESLNAQGISLRGSIRLEDSKFYGEVNLLGANIKGSIEAKGAYFSNPNATSLYAQELILDGSLFLVEAKFEGEACFSGAIIGGQFACVEATFLNHGEDALNCERIQVKQSVYLVSARFYGEVSFSGAIVAGQFVADGGRFSNISGEALNMQSSSVLSAIFMSKLPHSPIGNINFDGLNTPSITIDDSFYPQGTLNLNNMKYAEMLNLSAKKNDPVWEGWLSRPSRKAPIDKVEIWIAAKNKLQTDAMETNKIARNKDIEIAIANQKAKVKDFRSDPWQQFAATLDDAGLEGSVRTVRIEQSHRLARFTIDKLKQQKTSRSYIFGYSFLLWLYRHTTGYGHAPWKTVKWALILLIVGTIIFQSFENHFALAREKVYTTAEYSDYNRKTSISHRPTLPSGYPEFNAFVYSLDVMLPIVDFAQESHWRPANVAYHKPNWLRWYNRLHLIIGWMLSTTAVLGFTGLIKGKQ